MSTLKFQADARWLGGMKVTAHSGKHEVHMDEPANLGGDDSAMNPVQMLLCSLGGCLIISASTFASQMDIKLNDIRVELEGKLNPAAFLGDDPDARPGFQEISYEIHLESDAPRERLEKMRKEIEKRCPVSDNLANEVSLQGDYRLISE